MKTRNKEKKLNTALTKGMAKFPIISVSNLDIYLKYWKNHCF